MAKSKRKICSNCKHAGRRFKHLSMTHHHCEHPDPKVSDVPNGPWATLREFYNTCDHWEQKHPTEPQEKTLQNNE